MSSIAYHLIHRLGPVADFVTMAQSRRKREASSSMWRFLLYFFAIYGGANFYFYWKMMHTLPRGIVIQVGLGLFTVLMVLGPILVRMLERADWGRTAYALGLVSYMWMALLFWFVLLALIGDLWNLGVRGAGIAWPEARSMLLPLRPAMAAIGIILLVASVWGLVEAQDLRLERITVEVPDAPAGFKPLRVVQVSDIHLGLIERERRLRQVLRLIDEAKPDLLVSTGDLVDGTAFHMNHLARMLAGVKPPLGKYAVTGNHEYYIGIKQSLNFHHEAGFKVLRGESVKVTDTLRLSGVDDPTGRRMGQKVLEDEAALFGGGRDGVVDLLLKHRPTVSEGSVGGFDLQLSGHTHRGQIFPFGWIVRTQYRFLSGFHALGKGSAIYISRGTGTWGAPMRLGSRPEVTLIELVPGREGAGVER